MASEETSIYIDLNYATNSSKKVTNMNCTLTKYVTFMKQS